MTRGVSNEVSLATKPYKLHRMDDGPSTNVSLNRDDGLRIYKDVMTIRRMEAAANTLYKEKAVRRFCHLTSGQDTPAVDSITDLCQKITVHFRKKSGKTFSGVGTVGENLLDVVVNNNLDFDGFGACEGTLACSTCHLILSQEDYDRLPNVPTDEELDMLDLAYGLTDTSRLGCQVRLTKELDGMTVDVPEGINDVRSDS